MRGLDQHALGVGSEKIPPPLRSAGRGRISTAWESNCCPSPLMGSSRSEQRAKLTGLS